MSTFISRLLRKKGPELRHSRAYAPSSFERVLLGCVDKGDYAEAYESFANTSFFVPVFRNDEGPKTSDFLFRISDGTDSEAKGPALVISEEKARLATNEMVYAIRLRGYDLVRLLNPKVGIVIMLSDRAWGLPAGLIEWLRQSFQPVSQ